MIVEQRQDDLLYGGARDKNGTVMIDHDIDLRAQPEDAVLIYAGFDREGCAGQDSSCVMRFEVVHIRTRTMYLVRDAVSRPMNEQVTKTGGFDDVTAGSVNLISINVGTGCKTSGNKGRGSITTPNDRIESLGHVRRYLGSRESHPGDVGID